MKNGYEPEQEFVDTLFAAAERGVHWANNVYAAAPWKDPHTYGVVRGTIDTLPSNHWGQINILLHDGNLIAGLEGEDASEGGLAVLIKINPQTEIRRAKYWTEMFAAGSLVGMAWLANPGTDVFYRRFETDPERYEQQLSGTWTQMDWQAAMKDHMYDNRTRFTPTGHNPYLPAPVSSERNAWPVITFSSGRAPAKH